MIANGLRLLLAARKSRKGTDSTEADRYARQEHRAAERAEHDGHAIVQTVRDTVSSQSLPWERKNLKTWMSDPGKLAMWDALYVTETDRLARMDDKGFHQIESWLYEHDKKLITAEGVMFPPRDDSDRYQWLSLKRRARTYWEDVADKHAATREVIKANGAAIGRPPFGYAIEGDKLHKRFVIDSVNGPLAGEAFQRIADGRTASSVAEWLTEATGKLWRVKRVIEMIKRTSYLGSRDGHVYDALVSKELWESANAAMAGRSIPTGGRRIVNGYSGVISCPCQAPMYHHRSTRNGKPVGVAHYRCSRGRRGIAGEAKCGYPAIPFEAANAAINAYMGEDCRDEWVMQTTGGDAARQAELARIKADMNAAIAKGDMTKVGTLAHKYAELDAMPAEPIRTMPKKTGRTIAKRWASGTVADQRAMLANYRVTVQVEANGTLTAWMDDDNEAHTSDVEQLAA